MVKFYLQWHITPECDQRCKFCYLFDGPTYEQEKNNIQNLDGLKKILSNFLSFCNLNNVEPHISFTGGDPLLHPDFLKLCKFISQSKYFLSVECNFGVDLHAPGAFYEAMSVGSVCILSNQLKNLPNFEDTYITVNPLDIKDYTKKLDYSNQIDVENYRKMSKNSMDKINNHNFELGVIQRSNFFKEIINGYKKI